MDDLIKSKRFLYKWFNGEKPSDEEEHAFVVWFLHGKPRRELNFEAIEAEECGQAFFEAMAEERSNSLITFIFEGLWAFVNKWYYSWMRSWRAKKYSGPVCYEAQLPRAHEDAIDRAMMKGARALRELNDTDDDEGVPQKDGDLIIPEEPDADAREEQQDGERLPRNDWLASDGSWQYHLLMILLRDVEEHKLSADRAFEIFMTAIASQPLRVPSEMKLLEPLAAGWVATLAGTGREGEAVRLLLDKEGWKATSLKSRQPEVNAASEIRNAREAYRRAIIKLEKLDAVIGKLRS
jgi:hypothetical protein